MSQVFRRIQSMCRRRVRRAVAVGASTVGLLIQCATALAQPKELSKPLQAALAAAEKRDIPAAIKLLRTEAEKGNAEAAFALGELLLAGRSGNPEPAEAAKFFQQAADAAHAAAALQLARLVSTGVEGVPKDADKARFFFRAAAEAGLADAQFAIGAAIESEAAKSEREDDFKEARSWYEKAAEQQHGDALLALSRFYDQGLGGLTPNHGKGAEFCRRAAERGSVVAMNEMGVRYQKGDGLPRDNVAAIGWFTLAAQYDLPAAHTNLGHCYESGDGVRQDFDKAGQAYAAGAKASFAPAEFQLAQLFESGKGTAVDFVKAYALFFRAASGGYPGAAERRDALKRRLSASQLAAAQKIIASHRPVAPASQSSENATKKSQ